MLKLLLLSLGGPRLMICVSVVVGSATNNVTHSSFIFRPNCDSASALLRHCGTIFVILLHYSSTIFARLLKTFNITLVKLLSHFCILAHDCYPTLAQIVYYLRATFSKLLPQFHCFTATMKYDITYNSNNN